MQNSIFNRKKIFVFLIVLITFTVSGFSNAASTITQTTAYEYDPSTLALTKTIREPDNPQLRLETLLTYNIGGTISSTKISSPAVGNSAIQSRWTSSGVDVQTDRWVDINELGQTATTNVDSGIRKIVNIQAIDGTIENSKYDTFGRAVLVQSKDSTKNGMNYSYCNGINGGTMICPPFAKYIITETPYASDGVTIIGVWKKGYFDSADRSIRTETQGFDGISVITVDTEYDTFGRIHRTSRPYYSGQTIQWTTYTYDPLGRTVAVTTPDGQSVNTAYSGLTTIVTNALAQTQTTIKNSQNQIVQVIDAQAKTLSFSYDANANLIQTVDPAGNVVQMSYDTLGRKTSMVDPDLGSWTYVYDVLGELVQRTNPKGQVTTMTYDLLGRMTQRTEVDLVSKWAYDTCKIGQLCQVSTDHGYSKTITYDAVSRPVVEKTTIDQLYTTSNTFDANGRSATQTYPTGLVTKYIYTPLGYLAEIRNNTTNALYWQANAQDAEGHLTQQTYGNNVVTQQVFDPATGRMIDVYAGAGNRVQNLSFSYDARGNMLTRNDSNQNLAETFLYDSLNRLTSNTVNSSGAGVLTQSYGYDAIGNITSRSDMGTYIYGNGSAPHAVTQIALAAGGTRQYIYDVEGNLIQELQRDTNNNLLPTLGRNEIYSSFNKPTTLANSTATLTLVYGPDHQRIKQIAPAATTIYLHPGNDGELLYEKDIHPDGSVEQRQFITAMGNVVAVVKQTIAGASTLYFHRDQLGSTTATTDEMGAVAERFAYEPFGKRRTPAGVTDPNNTIIGITTARGFTNHEELDALDLVNMNGRIYDPAIGRFQSADSGVPYPTNTQSYNRYSYARNNPLVMIDPSGFTDENVVGEGTHRQSTDGGNTTESEAEVLQASAIVNGVPQVGVTGHPDPEPILTVTNKSFATYGGAVLGAGGGGVKGSANNFGSVETISMTPGQRDFLENSVAQNGNGLGSKNTQGSAASPLTDKDGNVVIGGAGKIVLLPNGIELSKFAQAGQLQAFYGRYGGAYGILLSDLGRFNRGNSWDLQRLDGHFDPRFIDAATIAIGVYAASANMKIDTILSIQDVIAKTSTYPAKTRMDDTYTHLPLRNVINTQIGYDLVKNGQFGH